MSCGVAPTFPRPGPGETTSDPWPQGLSRSTPINLATFGVGSAVVPMVPQQPYPAGAYTSGRGNLTLYNNTNSQVAAGQPLQFRSQADRIRYRLGLAQQASCQ
jgi:hypothetical protein